MVTWLDWYVKSASGSGSAARDLAVMRSMALALVSSFAEKNLSELSELEANQATFFSMLLPFFLTDEMGAETVASYFDAPGGLPLGFLKAEGVRLTQDLVSAFAGERCSEEIAKSIQPMLREKNWYFDLPQRSLMISEQQQIRAIFTQPSRAGQIVVGAVLTQPGRNEMTGRYFWQWKQSSENPIGADIEAQDARLLRERVEDLLALILAYLEVAGENERRPLPRLDTEKLQTLSVKKQKAKSKKSTLFSISDLRPPKDRFSKPVSADAGHHWSLSHQVEVRGHFRYQPHGPQRSLRKLIWIAPHQRGHGDKKPKLTILGKDNA